MLITTLILLTISGLLQAGREYVHKQADIFHVFFKKIKPVSFFGELMWHMKYVDYPKNKRPKNWIISILPYNDFWHSSHYLKQALTVVASGLVFRMQNNWFDFSDHIVAPTLFCLVILMFWGGAGFWLITFLKKKYTQNEK